MQRNQRERHSNEWLYTTSSNSTFVLKILNPAGRQSREYFDWFGKIPGFNKGSNSDGTQSCWKLRRARMVLRRDDNIYITRLDKLG